MITEGNVSIPLNVLGGYRVESDPQFNSERTINWYSVYTENGRTKGYLRPMRGFQTQIDTLGAVGRGLLVPDNLPNTLYAIVDEKFYFINNLLVPTQLGTLLTNTGFVDMEANQVQIGGIPAPQITIVDGVGVYVWNQTTFTHITSPGVPPLPIDISYQDGYMFIPIGNSNLIGVSKLNDATTYAPGDRLAITSSADICVGSAKLNRLIYIFGFISIERFYNGQTSDPPFVRDNNFSPNIGALSKGGIATGEGRIFFLSNTRNGVGSFYKLTGGEPQRISTHEIDVLIQSLKDASDCRSYVYKEDENIFYVINFNTDNLTLVYNDITGEWYEQQMLNRGRHLGEAHAYFNGSHYLLLTTGQLAESDPKFLTNDGEAIRYFKRIAILTDEQERKIRIKKIKFFSTKGLGNLSTPDNIPKLRIRVSKDSGVTFGYENTVELTPSGDYFSRAIARRIVGSSRMRAVVIELECTSVCNFNLYGGSMDINTLNQ